MYFLKVLALSRAALPTVVAPNKLNNNSIALIPAGRATSAASTCVMLVTSMNDNTGDRNSRREAVSKHNIFWYFFFIALLLVGKHVFRGNYTVHTVPRTVTTDTFFVLPKAEPIAPPTEAQESKFTFHVSSPFIVRTFKQFCALKNGAEHKPYSAFMGVTVLLTQSAECLLRKRYPYAVR